MRVAIALIFNARQEVLITQRAWHQSYGGLWEFPGGKIAPNETPLAALRREIKEEVGIDVKRADFLYQLDYMDSKQRIEFFVHRVEPATSDAQCCEAQLDLRWVNPLHLHHFSFPEANQAMIVRLNSSL